MFPRSGCDFHAPITRAVLEQNVYWRRGGGREQSGTLTYVNLTRMQYVKFAARRRIRCVRTCIPLSLSLSLLLLVAPSLLLSRARKRAERKVEAGNLSVDNESGEWERIGTMSKKKKKGKRKRWRFSEPISRLRFKQNVGRFFLEMEETLNKTFDLYVSRFLSLFSRDCSEKSPWKNNWPSS